MRSAESVAQLITVILLFIVVMAAAWLVTRWLAGYQKGAMRSGALEVMETCQLGPGHLVQIVRVAGHYVAIAGLRGEAV